MRLVPASSLTNGMLSAPCSSIARLSLPTSRLPLNGKSLVVFMPSSMRSSITAPPFRVMCALVVVKWKFIGTMLPGLTSVDAMMCSQARPWWAGRK